MSTNSTFLKEMGITEWTSRDLVQEKSEPIASVEASESTISEETHAKISFGIWWFFGSKPEGAADVLFQNIIRVLGLSPQEWSWKNPMEKFNPEQLPQDGSPIVALAFGGAAAQKLSGERDALSDLRETVLVINANGAEDLPLIATFELNQLVSRPKDKALFWQDVQLAKSVLQNI
ncbi:DNA polymerase III subunit psi [Polynucleobacter sp. UK-Mo-2m-Kol15]|uniref:DNA polymerase III subunit psi n=1 Tax=Polynucleobacter sp. UK-Mo-2m-Kol15 TaxID=2576916 RepID=UPI001C0ABF73|nr:DNA polymerase III subunit psi [Polynucleobacter sp. UK-Mo-2m-Kol15]